MFTCHRCGISTPRLTVEQTRCPDCQREVQYLIKADAFRRSPRTTGPAWLRAGIAKSLSGLPT